MVYAFVGFGFDVAASGAGGCACSSRGGDAEYDGPAGVDQEGSLYCCHRRWACGGL